MTQATQVTRNSTQQAELTWAGELGRLSQCVMDVDPMIHTPSRLAVLMIVRRLEKPEYLLVRSLTGLSKGNLSNHLAKLEAAGVVEILKHFEGKKPVTTIALTAEGGRSLDDYLQTMHRVSTDVGADY